MPKLTYGQSNAGISVPAGRYVCKFLGTEDREPFQESKFDRKGPPESRMAWLFEVVEGTEKGQSIAQETGCRATLNSTCARIILGLAGGQLALKADVDTDTYVGKVYSVKVAVNPKSDKGNLHVADLEPHQQNGTAPSASTAPVGNGGPPKRPSKPAPFTEVATPRFWIDHPKYPDGQLATAEDVRAFIWDQHADTKVLMLCKEGSEEWKPAAELGFEDARF